MQLVQFSLNSGVFHEIYIYLHLYTATFKVVDDFIVFLDERQHCVDLFINLSIAFDKADE